MKSRPTSLQDHNGLRIAIRDSADFDYFGIPKLTGVGNSLTVVLDAICQRQEARILRPCVALAWPKSLGVLGICI
jgi:hypothetical protein